MKNVLFALAVLLSFNINAQDFNLENKLPSSNKIKKGVLENGLTYYIYKTDVTKNAASYYIIQNVGAVLEDDSQQGLAHFLEHMAFNGTENFEGKGILNTLQKEGAVFGQDINAFTSFDETVYNINYIPTKPELIDTCLLILKDWSNGLLLTEEEIDAERGVIKEEWRTRQNGRMRIFSQSIPVLFNNTIYAKRMPIGLMPIIETFEYETLRNFYKDWYRTDLQAIAIIGDVDENKIESEIKRLFSDIPALKNPKERFVVNIPDNDKILFSLLTDKEVTTAQIEFGIRHPKPESYTTISDLKSFVIDNMITSMFAERINEIAVKPDAPFLNTSIRYAKNARSTNALTAYISPKKNKQAAAFQVTLEEINRAVKFGFTEQEIERTILKFQNNYQTQASKEDDKGHEMIAYQIQQNYLENIDFVDNQKQLPILQNIFDSLTKEEIHNRLKALYTQKNRFLIVTGVANDDNLTEEKALDIIKKVENDTTLQPYKDSYSGKTLIADATIKPGKIISEKKNTALNATTFKLSNGINVHYKYANKNKNDVKLEAISYGGLSLIDAKKLPSAKYTSAVVQQSGLAEYSVSDLKKINTGKTAATYLNIADLTESIYGTSVTKDVETMLQMVYLRFQKPRFDEDAFQVFKNQVDNYIIQRSKNIDEKINDSITVTLFGKNHPTKRLFNADYSSDIKFETIKNIYLERFNNPADFDFFIVGDVDKETLKPLLEKYIASLPTTKFKENYKDNSSKWITNKIDKDVFLKMEDAKSSVRINYNNAINYSLENDLVSQVLGGVLTLRYMETLREDEGGTYGASAYSNVSKRPTEKANLWVQFDCNPDKVEKLVAIAHNEILKISKGEINVEDISKIKNNLIKENTQQQDYNSFDMKRLKTYFREGYDINSTKNFEDIINTIDADLIKKFTKNLLKGADSYEIVIKPNNN